MTAPLHALTFDGAWGGTGWTLSARPAPRAQVPPKPILHGHFIVGDRPRRYLWLRDVLRNEVFPRLPSGPIIIGVEKPPMIAYRGNQTQICYGMGQIGGALQMCCVCGDLPEPVLVELKDWRDYYSVTGKDKAALKLAAINRCAMFWTPREIEAYRYRVKDGGPRGDVADSALQGAYLISHADLYLSK